MITNLVYINRDNKKLQVIETNYEAKFGKYDSEVYHKNIKEFYSSTIIVEWQSNNKTISISCEIDKCIRAYPTPDNNYVIVTYYMDSNLFLRPNNCVLYNADGTICRVIQYPKLISKQAVLSKEKHLFYLFMDGFKWVENLKGGFDVAIILCFGDSWYETRIYDYINDVFKECIEEGRY